jgi:phage baseplate assembly protein V
MNFIKEKIIKILKNMIRIGNVSTIDYNRGAVKVTFPDKDDIVSDFLPYLSFEYNMPKVGDTVLCVFLPNGISKGFCLGQPYSLKNMPKQPGPQYYYKNIYDEAFYQYDKNSKTLTIDADNIVLNAATSIIFKAPAITLDGETNITQNLTVNKNITVNGKISAGGNITSGGAIIDTAGNTNHHTH